MSGKIRVRPGKILHNPNGAVGVDTPIRSEPELRLTCVIERDGDRAGSGGQVWAAGKHLINRYRAVSFRIEAQEIGPKLGNGPSPATARANFVVLQDGNNTEFVYLETRQICRREPDRCLWRRRMRRLPSRMTAAGKKCENKGGRHAPQCTERLGFRHRVLNGFCVGGIRPGETRLWLIS